MVQRGAAVGAPVAHPKQIDMALARPVTPKAVVACGDALGEPPRDASLQLRPGKLVLYLPRFCLLDPSSGSAARLRVRRRSSALQGTRGQRSVVNKGVRPIGSIVEFLATIGRALP
jgi:hypothetical protein